MPGSLIPTIRINKETLPLFGSDAVGEFDPTYLHLVKKEAF